MQSIFTYTCALDIPPLFIDALKSHSRNANVILPQIESSKKASPSMPQLWVVYAPHGRVEYVLAVTEGALGAYPLFIFTTEPVATLAGPSFEAKMWELVMALREKVINVRRIYSVFAPRPICITFCNMWTRLTGIAVEANPNPYYDAVISYCTPQTLKLGNQRPATGHEHEIRLAVTSDAPMVATLCQGFSEESVSNSF